MAALQIVQDDHEYVPPPPAPDGLGPSGVRLWDSVVAAHELDVHEEIMLLSACRTADLMDRLWAEAATGPLTVVKAKGNRVTAPPIVEHRQQSLVYARMLASLRLPSGEEGARPQRRGAARGSYGVRYGNAQ